MKLTISGRLLLKLCCYASLAISLLPAVDYYCPWYITVIPVFLVLIVTIRMSSNVYPILLAFTLIAGVAVLSFWVTKRRDPAVWFFLNFFIAFLPIVLTVQIGRNVDEKKFYQDYLSALSFFTAVTCITTIIGLTYFPMASRELASGTAIYDTTRYSKLNIGGYEFIYALVLLIPVFFWLIDNSHGGRRFRYIVVLALDILCIYASQYTLALICCAIALLLVWMRKNRRAARIAIAIFAVFLLCNGFSIISSVFYWASEVVGQDYVADRLLQIAQLFSGQKVDTDTSDARIQHYMNQLDSFLQSPIWGHNLFRFSKEYVSGHTQILDILGSAGLIGLSILVGLFRKCYLLAVKPNRKKAEPVVRQVWIMAIVVAILNPIYFSIIITVVFMCCMCIEKIKE